MEIKVKIDGSDVALNPEETITLQKNSNLLSSAEKITTTRSYTVKAPFNPENHAIYKNTNLPSVNSDWLKETKPAELWLEDIPIFKGVNFLLSIGKAGYESTLIFDKMSALSVLIADKTQIKDLGLTDVFVDWRKEAPSTFTKEDYGLFPYLYGDFENDSDKMRQSASVNFIYLLDRVAAHYGIAIDTSEIPTHRYLTLTKNLNAYESGMNFKLSDFDGTQFATAQGTNNVFPDIRMGINKYLPGADVRGFLLESVEHISSVKVVIDGLYAGMPTITFAHYRGDDLLIVNDFSLNGSDAPSFDWIVTDLQDGDRLMYSVGLPIAAFGLSMEIIPTLKAGSSYPLGEDLNYIDFLVNTDSGEVTPRRTNQWFPILGNCDFTALELIKEVQLLLGLQLKPTGQNSIAFEPYTSLSNKTTATDYSSQFVSLEKSEFKFGDLAKINNYIHAPVNESIFGNSFFELTNIALPDKKDNTSKFGVVETYIEGNNSIMLIPQFTENEDGYYDLNDVPLIVSKLTDLGITKRLLCDQMQFDYILENEPYLTLIDKLEDLRVCELNLNFSALQYLNFDESKLIYIKSIGKYFAPITGDFNCKTGLFKLNALVV